MAQVSENRGWRRIFAPWTPSRALTAAGSPLVEPSVTPGAPLRSQDRTGAPLPGPARPDSIRARTEEWQLKALLYSEAVPELAGAAALARATADGTKWVVKGGDEPTRKRIQARVDAFDKARAQELLFLTGEVYIAVPRDPGADTPVDEVEAPYSLSVAEIKVAGVDAGRDQVKGPNGEWVDLVEENTDRKVPFMRVWRRSKENRWKGASSVKSVMDLLDAMYLAQLVDTATQKSRLIHAGVVFWPTNAPSIPIAAGEEPVPGSRQELQKQFSEATAQVIDMRSRGQEPAQPLVVMYDPGKGGESTKYEPTMFWTSRPDAAADRATRVDTDRMRLANGLELPVEAVTGMGGTNHWSAWQIDVDKWKTWGKPQDKLLREEFEKRVVKGYGKQFSLETDDTELIAKPDQTDVIVKLMAMQQVTPESGVAGLKDGTIENLVAKDPPEKAVNAAGADTGAAPGQPSDFAGGNGNRGGGQFRSQP